MMPRVTAPDRIFNATEVQDIMRRRPRRIQPRQQDIATEFWLSATAWYGWAKRRAVPIAFALGLVIGWGIRAGASSAIPPYSTHAPGAEANPYSADAPGVPLATSTGAAVAVCLPASAPQDVQEAAANKIYLGVAAASTRIATRANLARRDRLTDFVKAYNPRLSYEAAEAVVDVALTWQDYTWALACILAESSGNSGSVNSSSGCRGYWQIHPCHKRSMKRLGLDFYSEADRCAFARVLYAKHGKAPWAASKHRTAKLQKQIREVSE